MQLRDTAELKVPAARTADLVTTESKDEVLVYDQTVHHIHHLNATAAMVWRLCDGERTVSEIAIESGIAEDAVKLALRTLEDAKLLDGPLVTSMRGTQSRRAFMKKAGLAAAVAVPAVVSISAPTAAQSTSTCTNPASCSTGSKSGCCPGYICVNNQSTKTCQPG